MQSKKSAREAWLYLRRALRLRCPVCGTRPIFAPLRQTRTLRDWFAPLDGCPRCGYPYEREPGYFLLAIWAVNYGTGSLLGITLYIVLLLTTQLSTPVLIAVVVSPIVLFNLLFARHAKAIFIALDHFCDPHEKEGGDDGGNRPVEPPPPAGTPPSARPVPRRKKDTVAEVLPLR